MGIVNVIVVFWFQFVILQKKDKIFSLKWHSTQLFKIYERAYPHMIVKKFEINIFEINVGALICFDYVDVCNS